MCLYVCGDVFLCVCVWREIDVFAWRLICL